MTGETRRTARALMIMGTGSDAGKSLLVTALCRLFARQGVRVCPFKPQNMSNNAAVTGEGGEIGRAQALQARACGLPPSVDMNPVLLKPQTEVGAQVVVQGRVLGNMTAREYQTRKGTLLPAVLDSFRRLAAGSELVLVEGAGSASETNLRQGDIANFGFAEAADVPVVLVGDIDRGGVIAALVGTAAVLPPEDRARLKGFIINKMRGDATLFADGMTTIARHTGLAPLGILPWLPDMAKLPAEDALALTPLIVQPGGQPRGQPGARGQVKVAVPVLSRIANFDDIDPLRLEPGVTVEMVPPGRALPGDADLVILPGSKATIADLAFLRRQGWDIDLRAHVRRGGRVMGLCGGYQMLGRTVDDPYGTEGPPGRVEGLGYLEVDTVLDGMKTLCAVSGSHRGSGAAIQGYEMHIGRSTGPGRARPFLDLDGRPEGAVSADGRIAGTYVHGLFAADPFRRAFLALTTRQTFTYEAEIERILDDLATAAEKHLDWQQILALAAPPPMR